MRLVLPLLLVLAALAWALAGGRASVAPAVALDEAATAVQQPQRPQAPTVFEVLHAPDLAQALARFESVATPAERRRLRTQVDAACRVPVLLRLDGRDEPDPRRDPARRELERRCGKLPVPSMYVPVAETDLPVEPSADAQAVSDALAELHRARGPQALARAWLRAYQLDALPQEEIFTDRRRLLPSEAETLLNVVLDWRECERLRACGADSLFALRVCALHGCMPGSDLRSAWHQALAPRDYESAEAIHAWLLRWQHPSAL